MDIDGKEVKLNVGHISEIEDTLSYGPTLKKLFSALLEESRAAHLKERALWQKFEKRAKKQYPNYNKEEHMLMYCWRTRKLTITLTTNTKGG